MYHPLIPQPIGIFSESPVSRLSVPQRYNYSQQYSKSDLRRVAELGQNKAHGRLLTPIHSLTSIRQACGYSALTPDTNEVGHESVTWSQFN